MKSLVYLLASFAVVSFAHGAKSAHPQDWFPFTPEEDRFTSESVIDLRRLNEATAGQDGVITTRAGEFIYGNTGKPVRFWAVNGPSHAAETPEELRREARLLAKYGVNLIRIHGAVFDENGEPDLKQMRRVQRIVQAMKAEGIYSLLSIYFPLWFKPSANHPWLKGYNGNQHPFAALQFNPDFQAKYRTWWEMLLLTPDETNGVALIDEPAVMGVEIQNEDSYFFWTFSEANIPDPQLRLLETQFGRWLSHKYGSVAEAIAVWGGSLLPRDQPAEGRAAFRPLATLFTEKKLRDQDTAAFLFESQSNFYRENFTFLKKIGFKALITASNWTTANAEVLGPLDKASYTQGDFMDRHGYFASNHKGEFSEWSIRAGQTYSDRSALRFDGESPGRPKLFSNPVIDIKYNNLPSMISETTWCRPNRHRGEAPLYLATYGALQASNAIVHFAWDGSHWQVKPNYWMQPWTLMSPAMAGQFPAAALIFRQGLVAPGKTLASIKLNQRDLLALKGTPLPQDAAFDELRLKDVQTGNELTPGKIIDPLIHFSGRTDVSFTDEPGSVELQSLTPYIDRAQGRVTASNGQLDLDYRNGLLQINAPAAQGVSGKLDARARHVLSNVAISSPLDAGHIVLVSLDGEPLSRSRRMLLQVMSEEKATGFTTEEASDGIKRITDIGKDPWTVKSLDGQIEFLREDGAHFQSTALDFNGYKTDRRQKGRVLRLEPETLYYLVELK